MSRREATRNKHEEPLHFPSEAKIWIGDPNVHGSRTPSFSKFGPSCSEMNPLYPNLTFIVQTCSGMQRLPPSSGPCAFTEKRMRKAPAAVRVFRAWASGNSPRCSWQIWSTWERFPESLGRSPHPCASSTPSSFFLFFSRLAVPKAEASRLTFPWAPHWSDVLSGAKESLASSTRAAYISRHQLRGFASHLCQSAGLPKFSPRPTISGFCIMFLSYRQNSGS